MENHGSAAAVIKSFMKLIKMLMLKLVPGSTIDIIYLIIDHITMSFLIVIIIIIRLFRFVLQSFTLLFFV